MRRLGATYTCRDVGTRSRSNSSTMASKTFYRELGQASIPLFGRSLLLQASRMNMIARRALEWRQCGQFRPRNWRQVDIITANDPENAYFAAHFVYFLCYMFHNIRAARWDGLLRYIRESMYDWRTHQPTATSSSQHIFFSNPFNPNF